MTPSASRYATRELSRRTWPDFERFFSRVHGCACVLKSHGRHLPEGSPPEENLRVMKKLVWQGQAHGILVYANGESVGWCRYGPVEELPLIRDDKTPARAYARYSSTRWRISCFTTRIDYRRRGVATTGLGAAIESIRRHGGGWIEAVTMAFPHNDPQLRKLRKTYRWRSQQVLDYVAETWPEKVVPGIGRVKACLVTAKTMDHRGTMSMFERYGFKAIERDELASSDRPWDPYDFVLMRLKV